MSRGRRRGDVSGIICYSSTYRTWAYWNGGRCLDQSDYLPELRARWPKAEVHVQGELFGPETTEALNRADA